MQNANIKMQSGEGPRRKGSRERGNEWTDGERESEGRNRHAADEFRLQSRIQTAVQVGGEKGLEDAGEMRTPDVSPGAVAVSREL